MTKTKVILLILSAMLLNSCTDKGPVNYKSIAGSWRCEEFSQLLGTRTYMVEIDRKKNDSTLYLLSNFYDVDVEEFIFAQLDGVKLTIQEQQIGNASVVKSGTGTVSDNLRRIDLEYRIYDNQREYDVRAVLTR